jgi:hypothetical protein
MPQKNTNLRFFEAKRAVPDSAKKKIIGGKLKGMTNINPMFRIEALTEIFGPCGIGWRTENCQYWTTEGAGECVVWCSLDLYICENGQWSYPINGVGGSKLYGKGQGEGINDEAYKMAQTDALSVACKNLGFAADIYYGLDDTKYRSATENGQWNAPQPPQPAPPARPQHAAPLAAQQPQPQPQTAGPTLEQVIELARNAKTGEEVVKVWNTYRGLYGQSTDFKKAIKDNPNNPKRK